MPKLKTHRGAAKRFKKTKTGKIKRRMAFARHLMTAKSPKRRRNLRQGALVSAEDAGPLRRMLP